MKNLHAIMGAKFEHEKPNLCPTCMFRQPHGEWQGFCTAHGKVLSAANERVRTPRCKDYRDVEAPDADEAARAV